ncbi:MAG: type I DNA topoisomerase [Firmicutes bacterium]|nr:type I DNA topoisomerase [Bacillota bacterium]MDY3658710.1 type I DNA topoisomerase [Eubacteriales bacterium]
MKLVIIEGPGKRETLKKYLGAGFDVFATKGHVRDLPAKTFSVDLKNMTPSYEVMADKKELIDELKKKAKKAEEVLIATDPDREGEAIAWHITHILEIDPNSNCRIVFNEISKKAVNEALKHPRPIDMNLVDAQQTRRIMDRIVGYKLSPIICKRIKPKLSAGRVQSVALKLVVDREKEIEAFIPEEYWNISAQLEKIEDKFKFKASLNTKDGKKIKVVCKEEAEQVKSDLVGADYVVNNIKKSQTKSHAPAPFTTSTMQQDALNKLGMNLKKTSFCAQQLYEGVELEGEGKVALITYIRSDSTRVSVDAQNQALEYIGKQFGEKYVPEKPNVYKTKETAQDAHEAIRPISIERTPASVMSSLSPDNFKLYKLIYERFLASQMADAIYNNVNVDINAKNYGFKATGKTVEFLGYTAVYKSYVEKEDDPSKLPVLEVGEKLGFNELLMEQKFTKPPARYTEASLVKEMEEKGIGRPATYAMTITTLDTRGYTAHEGKSLYPTELGKAVDQYLGNNFRQVINVKFTADMENRLDEIAESGKNWQDVAKSFWGSFSELLTKAGGNYERIKIEPQKTDVVCDKCGAPMVVREGKYGKFLGCSAFPKCNNIMKLNSDKPKYEPKIIGKCPECSDGNISVRRSKAGKIYYACDKCKFYTFVNPMKNVNENK